MARSSGLSHASRAVSLSSWSSVVTTPPLGKCSVLRPSLKRARRRTVVEFLPLGVVCQGFGKLKRSYSLRENMIANVSMNSAALEG